MNLGKPKLQDLFNKQIKFRIPVFQRHYVWNEKDQWQPLWDDFCNKLRERRENNKLHPHYTGSIVLFQEATTTSSVSTYSVIDGQQRLTTFQLFITAFREICRKHVGDETLLRDINSFLFNDKVYGQTDYEDQKYKLESSKFNKEEFKDILDHTYEELEELKINPILDEHGFGEKTYKNEAKKRFPMLSAYLFFYEKLEHLLIEELEGSMEKKISRLLLTLKMDFQFVEINLSKDDDPQMIFETMNGRGASLTETDLIRNYIFMRANSNEVDIDSVYDRYWNEFDCDQSEFKWHNRTTRGRSSKSHLEFFVIDYLTLKIRNDIRLDQVFYNYKHFIVNNSFPSVEEELKELNRFSTIYKSILTPNPETEFGRFCSRLKDMDVSTIYPLIMAIQGDVEIERLEKQGMYKALDSYLTRRFLCGYTTKNYNKVFLDFIKKLDNCKTAGEFKVYLKSKTGDSNLWPTDTMLIEKLKERPIYKEEKNKTKSISNILLELEKYKRGNKQERVVFINEDLTIEHVLPQKWFEYWPLNGNEISREDFDKANIAVMNGEDPNGFYKEIITRNTKLNTIGNLTLLTSALNPSVGNSSFEDKKQKLASQSTLQLNNYFMPLEEWNESKIEERSELLIGDIIKIWKY